MMLFKRWLHLLFLFPLIVYFYYVLFLAQSHFEKQHLSESVTLYKYI